MCYNVLMITHPIHSLYAQHDGTALPGPAQCYLCGSSCASEYTVAKGIADTFNSHYLAKRPSSPILCSACYWYFNGKDHPDFRKMSLVVQRDSWRNWQRDAMKADISRWLADGLENDAYLVVSLSKKKHILLQAPMNAKGSREMAIQVEEQVAHVTLSEWQHMDNAFMELLRLGHNKGEILSGDLYGQTLRKHGRIALALMWSNELELWRKSPQIELLSYVTIFEKGQEDSGSIGANRSSGAFAGSFSGNDGCAASISTRIGDPANSSSPASSRVERDQLGHMEKIQRGHLEQVRRKSRSSGKDHEQLSLFSE